MPQSKKREQRRKQAQKDRPLRVNVIYAKPSPEGDRAWLRALKILMEAAPEPKEEPR